MPASVVLCTVPTEEHGRTIARTLVEERLAACVSMVPGLRSIYRWGRDLCDDAELLLLIKTRQEGFPRLMRRLQELHPYEVPEILAIAAADVSPAYLDWLERATQAG
jgi:periplasmic divalent cation tolerance protein